MSPKVYMAKFVMQHLQLISLCIAVIPIRVVLSNPVCCNYNVRA